jgi:hypothetical protein
MLVLSFGMPLQAKAIERGEAEPPPLAFYGEDDPQQEYEESEDEGERGHGCFGQSSRTCSFAYCPVSACVTLARLPQP